MTNDEIESIMDKTPMSPALPPKPKIKYSIKAMGYEALNYDFKAARPPHKTTNNIESAVLLIKTCLGGGVMTMPEVYWACGIWTALGLTIAIGLVVSYCSYLMTYAAQKLYGKIQIPQLTYFELAEASIATCPCRYIRKFSKGFRLFIVLICSMHLLSACCIYQIIIARVLKQLVERTDIVLDNENTPIRIYVLILMVPAMLLCMASNLKFLAPFSVVADAYMIAVAFATIYFGMKYSKQDLVDIPAFNSIPRLFEFIGVCVISLEGAGTSMVIENHMEDPNQFHYVLMAGMAIVMMVMIIIAFFGSWGFGENAQSPVTLNFPWSSFPMMLKIFMMITINVNFAINLWLVSDVLWKRIKRFHKYEKHWVWKRVYRCLIVAFIMLVAFILPNVPKFLALSGSFCCPAICFIYPAIINLSVEWEDKGVGFLMWRIWQFLIILIIGLVVFFIGTYINARELITELFYQK